MLLNAEALADAVVQAIETALGPVLERMAVAEARLSTLGDLRDRVVTVETKAAVPVAVPAMPDVAGALAPIQERMTTLEERVLALRSEVDSDDARHDVHEAALQRDGEAIKDRLGAVEHKIAAPMAALVDREHEAELVSLSARMKEIEDRTQGQAERLHLVDIEASIVAAVEKAVAALPAPRDGRSVTVDDVLPFVTAEVSKAMGSRPAPRDGVGVTGALVDRAGHLILTLTDGATKDVGPVVGRDVDLADVARMIGDEIAKIPHPKDGVDGLGFDDMEPVYDEYGRLSLKFVRGESVKSARVPGIVDRGVYKEGDVYEKGDGVTFGGAFWIAQQDTHVKPGESGHWRLAVKSGRDGRDANGRTAAPSGLPVVSVGRPR